MSQRNRIIERLNPLQIDFTIIYKPVKFFILALFVLLISCKADRSKEEILIYLKSLGNGSYLFGQVATWVHNENPDMDHGSNWLKRVYDHTGKMPRYGCVTYDFHDDPFPDSPG